MKTRLLQQMSFVLSILCVLSFYGFCYATAHAQLDQSLFTADGTAQSVQVIVTPEHPEPNSSVSFKVTSFLSDLDTASITWYVNNKKIDSGIGDRTFSTTIGAIGSKTSVKVVIITHEGNTITQTIPFSSSSVDIVWQAQSYVPPLYEGKALWSQDQSLKFVAIPHLDTSLSSLSPSNLTYTWSQDGNVLGSQSGYGKSTLTLNDFLPQGSTISVSVSNTSGSITAEKSISVAPSDPKILLYVHSPSLGTLSNSALDGTVNLSDKEINVVAVPYFFNINQTTAPYLPFGWYMNDQFVNNNTSNLLTLRKATSTTGTAVIYSESIFNQNLNTIIRSNNVTLSF